MKRTLKSLLFAFSMLVATEAMHAQSKVPQMFNYQGIARDVKGNPLSNQKMTLKLSVLPAADATAAEYEETQTVTTNEFGLYTLQIGNGQAVNGQMQTVKWETGNKYIKVAIDPKGGNNFVDAGTNQLLSVPYAIYADKAGEAANGGHDKTRTGAVNSNAAHVAGDVNYLTKFTALNTIGKSLIYDNGTRLGIGTAAPAAGTTLHMLTTTGNIEHIRMQNTNATGFGKFMLYNDIASNYATFTKYGSAYPGGYPGVASLFPYANMLAFGNNVGPFMLANNGNVGIGIVTAGTTKLYFNAQQSTGYLGLGSSFIPAANVHIGHTSTGDTLRITNATTGHLATDGLEIRNTGNTASIVNKEDAFLTIGTNNTDKVYISNNVKNMVGVGQLPDNTLNLNSGGAADTVGLGLSNNFDLFNMSVNFDGQLQFGANASNLGSSSVVFTLDDDGGGATVAQGLTVGGNATVAGRTGIGTVAPLARLHVEGEAAGDTTIYAQSNSGSNHQMAIFGRQPNLGFGAGVVGIGFGGTAMPTSVDIGVYGSASNATGFGVYSQGRLKVVDGTEGAQKTLVSDATGTATWSGAVAFKATGTTSATLNTGTNVDRIYGTELFDLGGAYNPATGIFTAPATGLYQFIVTTEFSGNGGATSGYTQLSLRVNGSLLAATYSEMVPPAISSFWTYTHTTIVQLTAGDQVIPNISNSTNANLPMTGTSTWAQFSGNLIR